MFAFQRDEFRAACFIALADHDAIQPRTYICSLITLQRAQQIRTVDYIGPVGMRAAEAIFVAHASQIRPGTRAPKRADIRSFATTRRAKI